jgi:hypothetical protein
LRSHPEDDILIGYAGGEADPSAEAGLAAHLAACPECRARVDGIQATLGNYSGWLAELKRELPLPPAPWMDLRARMRSLDAGRQGRVMRFPAPRPWWAAAAAAIAVAVAIPWLTAPRVVNASELLQKAIAQEKHAPARGEIRVKIRNLIYTRPAKRDRAAPLKVAGIENDAELSKRFAAAGYDWDNPLSAASFAGWRDGLHDRRDAVDVLEHAYRIETTSASNELAGVGLTLRVSNLQPVSETFRFRDNSVVEISEASAAPAPAMQPAPAVIAALPEPEAPPVFTPGDELRVIAALNRAGADLGEPVDVAPDQAGRQLRVTATGLDPARQEELRAALAGLPHVDLRFESPQAVTDTAAGHATGVVQAPGPLQTRLETYFGGRALVDNYINDVIAASERSLSRAHALRALGERFPAERERALAPSEREVLSGLVRRHLSALRALAAQLPAKLEPLAGPPPQATPARCGPWQECAIEMVQAAQRLDAALSRALASAQPSQSPEEMVNEVRQALAMWLGRIRSWQ